MHEVIGELSCGDFVVEVLVHYLLGFGERQTKRFNTTVAFCGLYVDSRIYKSTLLCKIPAFQLCRSS